MKPFRPLIFVVSVVILFAVCFVNSYVGNVYALGGNGGEGENCRPGIPQCDGSLVCSGGTCVQPTPTPTPTSGGGGGGGGGGSCGGLNHFCSTNSDCCSGLICESQESCDEYGCGGGSNCVSGSGGSTRTPTPGGGGGSGGSTRTPTPSPTSAPSTYTISGRVFIDANGNDVQDGPNGVQDASETVCTTSTNWFTRSGCQSQGAFCEGGIFGSGPCWFDLGEQGYTGATVRRSGNTSTTTNAQGSYTFNNLRSGSYTITLTIPTGYGLTTTNPVTTTVGGNKTVNFGIKKLNGAAGTEIYKYGGSGINWTKASAGVPGEIVRSGTNSINTTQALTSFNGDLIAGTYKSQQAEIYSLSDGTWSKISQPTAGQVAAGGTTGISGIGSLVVYNNQLYVGTMTDDFRAEVYRYNGGTSWTRVSNAAGQIMAGGTTNIDAIYSMTVYNNQLYVGTRRARFNGTQQIAGQGAEIYAFNGTTWTKVSAATPGVIAPTDPNRAIPQVDGMISFNGRLYVSAAAAGGLTIYSYDGATWTKVSQPTNGQIAVGGTAGLTDAAAMAVYNNQLYIGTNGASSAGDPAHNAEVYRYNGGTSWTRVSSNTPGQIVAGGTTGIDFVPGMAVYNNLLYIGTEIVASGGAEVYSYNGTTWTKVSQPLAGQISTGGTSNINGVWSLSFTPDGLYVGTEVLAAYFGSVECSDGIDNNANSLIDAADPGCHTDGDVNNPASYDPNKPLEDTQCTDGIDNNANSLIDAADPYCHTDGDASNPATYDPTDNYESAHVPVCGAGISANPLTIPAGGTSALSITCNSSDAPTYNWLVPSIGTTLPSNSRTPTYTAPTGVCSNTVVAQNVLVTNSTGTSSYNRDITVTPRNTVSGTVYLDTGFDNCATGTPFSGGATVTLYNGATSTGSSPVAVNGTYSINDAGSCGNRTAVISNISTYRVKAVQFDGGAWGSANLTGYTYGPFDLSNNHTLNYCISNNTAWIQTTSGDVRFVEIPYSIPAGKSASNDATNPSVFSSSGPFSWQIGNGTVSPGGSRWKVDDEYGYDDGVKNANGGTSYSFYKSQATRKNITLQRIPGCPNGAGDCTITSSTTIPTGAYTVDGNLTINSYSHASGAHVLILVSGTTTVNSDVVVPNTAANLLIIASKGNMTVTSSQVSGATQSLQGIFTSEGNVVASGTTCIGGVADKQLNIQGSVVANSRKPLSLTGSGNFVNNRSLCAADQTTPSITVAQRLDFIIQLTDFYKTAITRFQEVNP